MSLEITLLKLPGTSKLLKGQWVKKFWLPTHCPHQSQACEQQDVRKCQQKPSSILQGILKSCTPHSMRWGDVTVGKKIIFRSSPLWHFRRRLGAAITVETLYSTIYYSKYFIELNFDKSTQYVALWTHKRHPIPRPFGRAMECLLWVLQQKFTVL